MDQDIAKRTVEAFCNVYSGNALEVGPGTGVLTNYLLPQKNIQLALVEIDMEAAQYLEARFDGIQNKLLRQDFLEMDLQKLFSAPLGIIGNFPYNISSQIMFKVLENRDLIPVVVGMFQREVARRFASGPGNKEYGIISVLLQAFYDIEYLFTVDENVFNPPPKVKSAVIRFVRNQREKLPCDEKLFFRVVKTAFNQRRKTLRNALKPVLPANFPDDHKFLHLRAERLSVNDFIELAMLIKELQVGTIPDLTEN